MAAGAGVLLHGKSALLSFLLATAGGAMLSSVIMEIRENAARPKGIWNSRFAMGLVMVSLMNGMSGLLQS